MDPRPEPTNPDSTSERRAGQRRRMLKHVQVLSLDKKATSAIDLTLRNTSSFGAQLFGPPESLGRIPDEFYLVAPNQLRMVRCKTVWKGEDMVGVSFRSDPGALAPDETAQEPRGQATPADDYYLDRASGAVVRKTTGGEVRALERTVAAALGLKVEIADAGAECRIVLHVGIDHLNEICRRLMLRA